MLTKQEKREILKDAADSRRCEAFRAGREPLSLNSRCLDELIKFLDEMQKFSSFSTESKPTLTSKNKL